PTTGIPVHDVVVTRAVALVVLATAVAAGDGVASARGSRAPAPCRTATLSLSRAEQLQGGTGVAGWIMRVTNRSPHSCRLRRRPNVPLTARDRPLPFSLSYHRRSVWFCDGIRDHGIQSLWLVVPVRGSVFFAFPSYRSVGRLF